jgi:predicted phosphodiesterase
MATICIADVHGRPGDDQRPLIEFVKAQKEQGNKVVSLGDWYEGFLCKPWYVEELSWIHWIIGNHEFFWRKLLRAMYGNNQVSDYLWVKGVYLCHGHEYDPWQDTEIEIAMAAAALRIYEIDPANPFLDYFYDEIMSKHRTNKDIISGLLKTGIGESATGHSHVIAVETVGKLRYINPGSWRDKRAWVQIEESGEMHLEAFR